MIIGTKFKCSSPFGFSINNPLSCEPIGLKYLKLIIFHPYFLPSVEFVKDKNKFSIVYFINPYGFIGPVSEFSVTFPLQFP